MRHSWLGRGRIGNAGKVRIPGIPSGEKSGVVLAEIEKEGCHVTCEGKGQENMPPKREELSESCQVQHPFPPLQLFILTSFQSSSLFSPLALFGIASSSFGMRMSSKLRGSYKPVFTPYYSPSANSIGR